MLNVNKLDVLKTALNDRNRADNFLFLKTVGWLRTHMPEVDALWDCRQNPKWHPEGSVGNHTYLLLKGLSKKAPFLLSLAGMLHDVGKPVTTGLGNDGAVHSYQHEKVGAKIAKSLCKSLGLDEKSTELVKWLVRSHMQFNNVIQMREAKLRVFLNQPYVELLLELHNADRKSSNGDLQEYNFCKEKLEYFKANPPQEKRERKLLISGSDLISAGVLPGPEIGVILNEVAKAQAAGVVKTAEEALKFAISTRGE